MSKFGSSSNKKEVPQASSNSLSDIVFMLLFFFMVTTQMRETEQKVKVTTDISLMPVWVHAHIPHVVSTTHNTFLIFMSSIIVF